MHDQPRGTAHAAYHLALSCLDDSTTTLARLHTRHVLRGWGLARLADDAEVIVSELVTNATQASRALPWEPPVGLDLRVSEKFLIIETWDQSPLDPQPREADPGDVHGRGLHIVEAFSSQWGWGRIGPWLKRVWATIDLPDAAA